MQYGVIDTTLLKSHNGCNLSAGGWFPMVFEFKRDRGVWTRSRSVLRGCPWLYVAFNGFGNWDCEVREGRHFRTFFRWHSDEIVSFKIDCCLPWVGFLLIFFQKIKQSLLDKTVVGMRKRFHRWLMRMSQTQDLNLVLLFPQAILSSSRNHYHQDFRGSR